MLLTRAPLYRGRSPFSLDLHVLGAPLTFVLSQDQTLQLDPSASAAGLTAAPPYGSLSILLPAGPGGPTNGGFPSTRAISRGVMGLSFQGPRGGCLHPIGGAEPSPAFPACQRDFVDFSEVRPRGLLPFGAFSSQGPCPVPGALEALRRGEGDPGFRTGCLERRGAGGGCPGPKSGSGDPTPKVRAV